jgi:hypothetical protein
MIVVREPVLHPVAIADLRPTQITVGMREVEEKRTRFRRQPMVKVGKFLGGHMIPVIKGPKNNLYVIDHHHLALALHKERIPNVLVITVSDLSSLDMGSFWTVLDHRAWVHPYDAEGRRRSFRDLPKSVASLEDDPFRSLAGAVRRAGGFAKDTTPYAEFLWADFFRRRIKSKEVQKRFAPAVQRALVLAKSEDARYLPGWSGAVDI